MIYIVEPDFNVTPHFKASELACKGGGVLAFQEGFLGALENLRQLWDAPMTVNSCCRSPDHNTAVGGHHRSLHLTLNKERGDAKTMAIDFSVRGMQGIEAGRLHNLMKELGWSTGYNVSKEFIHADLRTLIGLERKDFFY